MAKNYTTPTVITGKKRMLNQTANSTSASLPINSSEYLLFYR